MNIIYDLKKLDDADYDICIEYIVENLKKKSFIFGVYQFGSIKFPGISDIDIMIVLDDLNEYSLKKNCIEEIIRNAPNSEYCFWHESIIISKKDLAYIKYFHTVDNIKKLFAISEDIIEEQLDSKTYYNLILMWNAYFYQMFLQIQNNANVSLRQILLILNNMKISINNNNIIYRLKHEYDFESRVAAIRKESISNFSLSTSDKINKIFNDGLDIISKQEKLSNSDFGNFDKGILFDFKERKLFISGDCLSFYNFRLFQLFILPKKYFIARDIIKNNFKTVIKENSMSVEGFYKMRERFASVKILDI
ncbi:hypothetical protein [Succinispira mobilis]|uniref:hypothetical protein n=1 Tax=Succinispira mobilis TaxID=78120 RepID=UPI0003753A27|nr:hypothetical protein [Succinispira mobilis]